MKNRILLVGTVRNVETILPREYSRLKKALSAFGDLDTFLVESDSSDRTVDVLSQIANNDSRFKYVSLGKLDEKYPHRIERIRYCRNAYVEKIRASYSEVFWKYVVVADLDGMNNALSSKSIASCFTTEIPWSACFANQKNGYYDLYALRAQGWIERDCFDSLEDLKRKNPFLEKSQIVFFRNFSMILHYDRLRQSAIYGKMKKIPRRSPWIEVNSAFGGLGVYKSEIFLQNDYNKLQDFDEIYSEHIDLHMSAKKNGARFFINPQLINSKWNVYNLNRIWLVRIVREIFKMYPRAKFYKKS